MKQRFLVGSCLLGLSSPHDIDYIVLMTNTQNAYYVRRVQEGYDCSYRNKASIDHYMLFKEPFSYKNIWEYIINYQLDYDIVGHDFPFEYHVLNQRQKYIEMLRWIIDNQALNFNKKINLNNRRCSKQIYHVAYTTFILKNNSTVLTPEQKAIVQRIHDKQMPVSYLDELEAEIRALK